MTVQFLGSSIHDHEQSALQVLDEFKDEEEKKGALSFIAQALAAKGNIEAAEKYQEQLSPHGKVRLYMAKAEFYVKQGNLDKAKELVYVSANLLYQAEDGYTIFWQNDLVEFALGSLNDTGLALMIAGQMPPEFGTITMYTQIAEAQCLAGDKNAAMATLQVAEQRTTAIPEKARVEDSRLKAEAEIAEAYLRLGLFEAQENSSQDHEEFSTTKVKELIHTGQNGEAVLLLDQELKNATTFEGQQGDDYVRWARELYYSLSTIAQLYNQAGNVDKTKEVVETHLRILSSTRDHENRSWYHNVLQQVFHDALAYGYFDIAEQVINEITSNPLKSHAHVQIATAFLNRKEYDQCGQQLTTAESEASKIEQDSLDLKSRCYLEISNTYKLLEKTLQYDI